MGFYSLLKNTRFCDVACSSLKGYFKCLRSNSLKVSGNYSLKFSVDCAKCGLRSALASAHLNAMTNLKKLQFGAQKTGSGSGAKLRKVFFLQVMSRLSWNLLTFLTHVNKFHDKRDIQVWHSILPLGHYNLCNFWHFHLTMYGIYITALSLGPLSIISQTHGHLDS